MNHPRIFVFTALLLAALGAHAQTTRIIVPTAPGGGTDGFFRVIAKDAEPFLGGNIVIMNLAGAGGTLGLAQMARSAPDGFTLAGIWLGPVTVGPHTLKVTYTPDDYIPIMQLTSAPYVMCVHPDFPASDGKSFIEQLRKNPGKYTYGNDGVGAPGQLATERIFRALGASAVDVPFKGAGETILSFLGKHIDIYTGSIPPVIEFVKAGKAKCVLLSSADKNPSLPHASSLTEMGIPNEETLLWRGLLAPKGTPPERIAHIEAAFRKAAASPATKKYVEDAGEQILIRSGADFRDRIRREYEALGKIVKSLNLAPQ